MFYQKTHEGKAALRERTALSLRERQVMVLFNGNRSMADLVDLFGESVGVDVEHLRRRGLIVLQPGPARPPAAAAFSDLAEPDLPPPTQFLASTIDATLPSLDIPASVPRMSLDQLTALADVPPPNFAALAGHKDDELAADEPPRRGFKKGQLAAAVNGIDAEHMPQRSALAAQIYMTQVLMALATDAATQLIETSGDVRHDVDVLLYLAQGLGHTYAVAGEDVTLRVAMRVSRLLPEREVPMLLDCALDYTPSGFSVLLYEFVLAGRETSF